MESEPLNEPCMVMCEVSRNKCNEFITCQKFNLFYLFKSYWFIKSHQNLEQPRGNRSKQKLWQSMCAPIFSYINHSFTLFIIKTYCSSQEEKKTQPITTQKVCQNFIMQSQCMQYKSTSQWHYKNISLWTSSEKLLLFWKSNTSQLAVETNHTLLYTLLYSF